MDTSLLKILEKIHKERNVDFSGYRENMVARRVMVRVRITRSGDYEHYLVYLETHPQEMESLMDVMTINVTEFFRDQKVFEVIEKKLIPDIFKWKKSLRSREIRVWSCGCATGEETHSLLMCIADFLGERLAEHQLTILGTDIDKQVLAKAREGIYEEVTFKNVSSGRMDNIKKYFDDIGGKRYQIRKEWSAYIDFKQHDMIRDVIPKNMDLIVCRNVFIYFDRELQERILDRFWDCLNPGGFLVLGNVETISCGAKKKFVEYDRCARIYIKK